VSRFFKESAKKEAQRGAQERVFEPG